MERDYARRYRTLYERHWWWRARERLILDVLARARPASGWGAILDVGCGDGLFFHRLLELGDVEGVEPDASLVSADNPHQSRIYLGPFDERFQPGKHYSLILMLDVLEHLPDPAPALRRAGALLAPGGLVLVTVPAFHVLWTKHDELNQHYSRYTRASFERLARAAGMRVEWSRYFFHWVFPAKLLVRVLEVFATRSSMSSRLPPRWLNRSLYLASRAEQLALGALPLPFGSSLLVLLQPSGS